MTAKNNLIAAAVAIGFIAVFLGVVSGLFSGPDDPKSIQYILWKHDLYSLDRDDALIAFYSDRHRGELILGKTPEQLAKRFGHLLTPAEASPGFRNFYESSAWKGREVRFIKGTGWIILFDHDKAVDMMLVKG